jgi:hypothetical protein
MTRPIMKDEALAAASVTGSVNQAWYLAITMGPCDWTQESETWATDVPGSPVGLRKGGVKAHEVRYQRRE